MALSDKTAFDEVKVSEGGGYVAMVKVERGYKVYPSGVPQADTFYPCDVENKEAVEATLAKAKEAYAKPARAFRLTILKNSVLNKDVTAWKGDRLFDYAEWTPACKEIIRPSLDNFMSNSDLGKPFWARVNLQKSVKLQQGAEVDDFVPFLADRFNSEAEARESLGLDSSGDPSVSAKSTLSQPSDYDESVAGFAWSEAVDYVTDSGKDLNPLRMKKRAGELNFKPEWTNSILEGNVPF